MAIQCTHCGTVLKDNARFCNICGTLVPSNTINPKSNVPPPPASAQSDHSEESRSEPVTPRPPFRPAQRTLPDGPPAWMHQLENSVLASVPSNSGKDQQKPSHQETSSDKDVPQLAFPAQGPEIQTASPVRELRVKVWEQDQPTSKIDQNVPTQVSQKKRQVDNDEVEDLPTRPLVAQIPSMVKPQHPINTPSQKGQAASSDNVDQLDTVPMITHSSVKPHTISRSVVDEPQRQPWQQQDDSHGRAMVRQQPLPVSPHSQHNSDSFVQDYQESLSEVSTHNLRQTPPPLVAVPSTRRPVKRKNRKSITMLVIILVLLIAGGGLATWFVLYQPFTVAAITQPQQTFSNTQMGVSLQYPRGWTARLAIQKSTLQLADSSQTAWFSVVFTPTNGGDVNNFLRQEASQLTMTALKSSTSQTFAGTSWQQLQGNVLFKGATYTETLFATAHQQKVYTMMQLAPQTTYLQEEQLVFSAMRSSFHFIA